MHQFISIIGSTGSIGTQALDIIRRDPGLHAVALAAKENIGLLREQIEEFCPEIVCVFDEKKARELSAIVKCQVVSGMEGLIAVSTYPKSDLLVTGVSGMIGIEPTMAAIQSGKDIALANKETLVCAGELIMQVAKEKGVRIYPVDSEHSAIFQCLDPHNPIRKILLTCSGGPFRGYSKEMLKQVTLEQTLAHPTWNMGPKVTIDCSNLINKGLEVIEASRLFGVNGEQIQVVIHPQSIVHSLVEYEDNAVLAQLGTQDMRIAIAYAMYYPKRKDIQAKPLDFWQLQDLHFEKPDTDVFEGLDLAYEALQAGGTMPVVLNAANEKAVSEFIRGNMRYCEIPDYIRREMHSHSFIQKPDLSQILEIAKEYHC